MKYITKLFILITFNFLIASSCDAKDFDIKFSHLMASKVENAMPQIYIFDHNGRLIHHSRKYYPGLIRAFKNTNKIDNAESMTHDLLFLLNIEPLFKESEFTLFYISVSQSVGPCPPCRKQESILEIVKNRTKDRKINFNTVTVH